eukprot:13454-Eustigmatos_ZCMA.PRE.1
MGGERRHAEGEAGHVRCTVDRTGSKAHIPLVPAVVFLAPSVTCCTGEIDRADRTFCCRK